MHIAAARAAGYTASQVLNFLSRTYPQLSTHIQMASTAGYTADQISKYLSRYGPKAFKQFAKGQAGPQNVPYKDEETNPYIKKENTIREKEQVPEGLKTAGKVGLGLAGGALGAYALKRAAPAIVSSLFGGQSGQQTAENPVIGGPAVGQQPIQQIPTAQAPQPTQPKAALPTGNASNLFNQMGLGTQVKQMSSSQPADVIAKILDQHMLTPSQKKWLQTQTDEPLEGLVSRFLSESSQPGQAGTAQEKQSPEQQAEQEIPSLPQESPPLEQPPVEPTKPEAIKQEEKPAKKTTYLPSGDFGKVLSEKDGIAKIEVDGKIKHRKVEDLLETDKTPEELADLYEEAYFSIPKHLRSSNLFWGGYDEGTNRFAYLPHGGALYTYDDVPTDLAKQIKELLVTAKTTGSSAWGVWSKGDPSRGAAMFAVIEKLKTREKEKAEAKSKVSGKKEPVEKEYSGKFEPVYAPFQSQQKIVQKRHREREKLKRQKEKERNG